MSIPSGSSQFAVAVQELRIALRSLSEDAEVDRDAVGRQLGQLETLYNQEVERARRLRRVHLGRIVALEAENEAQSAGRKAADEKAEAAHEAFRREKWLRQTVEVERRDLDRKARSLEDQLRAVQWDYDTLKIQVEQERRLVPEHAFCPECETATVRFEGAGLHCQVCGWSPRRQESS